MKLTVRMPNLDDSKDIFQLISSSKPLDVNSEYLYMLICDHFKSTSVVVESSGDLIGVITGYILPEEPRTLFVWQVAIDSAFRGKAISSFMFENILSREYLAHVDTIKTTVSPSNIASLKMFQKLAKNLDTEINSEVYIKKEHFLDAHEDEILYTIGQFNQKKKEKFYANI